MATAFTRAKREIIKRTAARDRLTRPHGSRFWDEPSKAELRAEAERLSKDVMVQRVSCGKPVPSIGKARRQMAKRCYGDGTRRGPVFLAAWQESV